MLPGIALVYLFGNQGLLRSLLTESIYGYWGLVLGEVILHFSSCANDFTPHYPCLMLVYLMLHLA